MGSGKGNPELWVAVVQARAHPLRAGAASTRSWRGPPWSGPSRSCRSRRASWCARAPTARAEVAGLMPTAHDLCACSTATSSTRASVESRRELFNLRFQLATGQLDNTARIGQVRREVARMLTVLREREILEAEGAYVAPTAAEREAARAKLAAEDAEREEKAAAKAATAEAEADGGELHDHDRRRTPNRRRTTTKRMRPDGRRDPRERGRRAADRADRRLDAAKAAATAPRGGRGRGGQGAARHARSTAIPRRRPPRRAIPRTAARANRRKVREGIVVSDAMAVDRGRGRDRAGAPPRVRQDGAAHQAALRARRRRHAPRSATGSGWPRPGRCPS